MKGWGRIAAGLCVGLLLGGVPVSATPYSEFNTALALRNSGDCPAAIGHFTAALDAPDLLANFRPVALHGRAECYFIARKYDEGFADINASLRLDPRNYDALFDRARANFALKHYGEAEADFRTLQKLRPDLTKSYVSLALLYEAQKRFDAAIAQYSDLLKQGINNPIAYTLRARSYVMAGDYERARSDTEHLVKLVPKDPSALILRSWVYGLREEYDDALTDIDAALALKPDRLEYKRDKGLVYWKMGRYDEAAEAFAQAEVADPYAVLWLGILSTARNVDDPRFSARAAKIDLKTWPGPLVALYAGKSSADAVQAAVAAADEDVQDNERCEAAFYSAEWSLRQHDVAGAKALLNTAATSCPVDDVERDAARVQLKRLQ